MMIWFGFIVWAVFILLYSGIGRRTIPSGLNGLDLLEIMA